MGDDWLINQFGMTQQKLINVVPPPSAKDKDKVEPAVVAAPRPHATKAEQQSDADAEVLRHPGYHHHEPRQGRGHLRRRSSISVVPSSAAEWTFDHEAPRTPERQNSIDS
ncbi:hypothetical protein JCM21900_000277, partial [Sporobolomyces salmonicolor]